MTFDLPSLLAAHATDGAELQARYLNPQLPRTLRTIGFDKNYVRGEGAYLFDAEGNAYADFLSGFGVFAAGRSHPVIKQALADALEMDFAAWTQFDCPPIQGLLAERLLAKAPGLERVFFCNSGTEAVESALKFARHATGKGRIVYARQGFHGLTTGSLSWNGGAEVQGGLGRTGKFFSYDWDGDVRPDIVTVAKALSGGYVPVGAMLTTDKIYSSVYSSMDKLMKHSTTFKGGPLAMAAGLAALAVIDDEGLVENAARRGAELMRGLEGLKAKYDLIADIRGKGLIIGIEFGKPSGLKAKASWAMLQKARVGLFAQTVVVALFQRHRILTQVSGDHMEVIKLIPPLMIGDAEVKLFLDGLADVLEDASKGSGLMWDFGRTLIKQAVRS